MARVLDPTEKPAWHRQRGGPEYLTVVSQKSRAAIACQSACGESGWEKSLEGELGWSSGHNEMSVGCGPTQEVELNRTCCVRMKTPVTLELSLHIRNETGTGFW